MKFLISIILITGVFGLTFSEPEKKVIKNSQIQMNNSETEWLTESNLNSKVEKQEKLVLADVLWYVQKKL